MASQSVSGSKFVTKASYTSPPIKDRAVHHKNLGSKTVREMIDESIQDNTKPKAITL